MSVVAARQCIHPHPCMLVKQTSKQTSKQATRVRRRELVTGVQKAKGGCTLHTRQTDTEHTHTRKEQRETRLHISLFSLVWFPSFFFFIPLLSSPSLSSPVLLYFTSQPLFPSFLPSFLPFIRHLPFPFSYFIRLPLSVSSALLAYSILFARCSTSTLPNSKASLRSLSSSSSGSSTPIAPMSTLAEAWLHPHTAAACLTLVD